MPSLRLSLAGLIFSFVPIAGRALAAEAPTFNRDVRPILSAHCFKCHGPDDQSREAGLRFDVREAALAETESGARAIVPGKPDESELMRRICAADADELMPPAAANKPLSEAQKRTLRAWIEAGAPYESHWAFVAPKQAALPAVSDPAWPKNAIDYFVLAKLDAAGLEHSAEADSYTLVRRLYLDLIGLPPTPAEVDAYITDKSPDAYDRLVTRLLASPHYGERWARRWLDVARYADTNGYEKDRVRSIWPYRDWVIGALNADLPFDRFTIKQLAGDLLPGATIEDRIATGFHRNTMLNEEGGIDPLEFRYHAMVDRVNTTGTAWLGLTLGCVQCHTHKYDPIPHADYYRLMAYLNNADEPEMDVPRDDIAQRRAAIEAEIAMIERDLTNRFPLEGEFRWHDAAIVSATAQSGAAAEVLEDRSIRLTGTTSDADSYTITLDAETPGVAALQIEALTDPQLPGTGPGRAPNGNFVLTEITASVAPAEQPDQSQVVALASATADFAQDGFPVEHAFDGNAKSGWAIAGSGKWNVNRAAVFRLAQPTNAAGKSRWTIRLDQQYGGAHTLGRLRIRFGERIEDGRPEAERRQEHLERKFNAWLAAETARSVRWTLLTPTAAASDIPTLTILDDKSIIGSGDQSKRDVYRIKLAGELPRITALRLEALPDESLPKNGPGRIAYEGPFGDFFLSEFTLQAGDAPVKLAAATHSFAAGNNTAAAAIDGDPQTGWSINGGQGRAHTAVFVLAEPLTGAQTLDVQLLFERYYAAGLGRFRIWATNDGQSLAARDVPTSIEALLQTPAQLAKLRGYFLSIAPELSPEHERIAQLRSSLPEFPTTLVMQERPASHPRATHIHKRGEYLQPTDAVEAGLPKLFGDQAGEAPRNRLEFARWLASERNPLVARVAVNRQWAAIFGRGIVRTTEDFGYQGEPPTHPELLDWLAVEFMRDGWSLKNLHRLIVTSATYRQASNVTPEQLERDPQNKLLARAPRVRLDAELVRDAALRTSGLLSAKIGGPSVFPPQPAGVTSEGAYGPLAWNVSQGEDRYRRGLYTFAKRTAPYAMFLAFDAPSGEACLARRELSNTPLQALTLLNDEVFVEAARALGRELTARDGATPQLIGELFSRCVSRPPTTAERDALVAFHDAQLARLAKKELDAAKVAGAKSGDLDRQAAWTLTARAVMNLDEAITKE